MSTSEQRTLSDITAAREDARRPSGAASLDLRTARGPARSRDPLRSGSASHADSLATGFHTILFPAPRHATTPQADRVPAFFRDLNLDQIVEDILASKQEYDLKSVFLHPLQDIGVIEYRHEVMADLENPTCLEHIHTFATAMRAMREHIETVEKTYYKEQKEARFLDAVEIYCDAVTHLATNLNTIKLKSRGLLLFSDYLSKYIDSDHFVALRTKTKTLKRALSEIKYALRMRGDRVRVRRYQGERDYAADVAATFARFARESANDYLVRFAEFSDMNHVEAEILKRVARLYPEIFTDLEAYHRRYGNYSDEKIIRFDREIQFYVSYLEYIAPLRKAGLQFCYPRLSKRAKAVYGYETFDLALAAQLIRQDQAVVCNDLCLKKKERIFVVSGPNQGGKTTFARTFGQLHYLAGIGCPVPGREARMFLFDRMFTHFEKEEHVRNLRGKLEDDLLRIHGILDKATPESIIILNEIFTSTTLRDAVFLSQRILERIIRLDALCVCVTFIDELAALAEQTVSVVATVAPENPALRTYKIVRRPADGLAYAMAIAQKYRLTYGSLKERLRT